MYSATGNTLTFDQFLIKQRVEFPLKSESELQEIKKNIEPLKKAAEFTLGHKLKGLFGVTITKVTMADLNNLIGEVDRAIKLKIPVVNSNPLKRFSTSNAGGNDLSKNSKTSGQSVYANRNLNEQEVEKTFGISKDFFAIHKLVSGHLGVKQLETLNPEDDYRREFIARAESCYTQCFEFINAKTEENSTLTATVPWLESCMNIMYRTITTYEKCMVYALFYQGICEHLEDLIPTQSFFDNIFTEDYIIPVFAYLYSFIQTRAYITHENVLPEHKMDTILSGFSSDYTKLLRNKKAEENMVAPFSPYMADSNGDSTVMKSVCEVINFLIKGLQSYDTSSRDIVLKLSEKEGLPLFKRYCIPYPVILASCLKKNQTLLSCLMSTSPDSRIYDDITYALSSKYDTDEKVIAWHQIADDPTANVSLTTDSDSQLEILLYYMAHAVGAFQRSDIIGNENALATELLNNLTVRDQETNIIELTEGELWYIGGSIDPENYSTKKKGIRPTKQLKLKVINKILIKRLQKALKYLGEGSLDLEKLRSTSKISDFEFDSAYQPYYKCSIVRVPVKKTKKNKTIKAGKEYYKIKRNEKTVKPVDFFKQVLKVSFDAFDTFKVKSHRLVDVSLVGKLVVNGWVVFKDRQLKSGSTVYEVKVGDLPIFCFPVVFGVSKVPKRRSKTLNEYISKVKLDKPSRGADVKLILKLLKELSGLSLKFTKTTNNNGQAELDCTFINAINNFNTDKKMEELFALSKTVYDVVPLSSYSDTSNAKDNIRILFDVLKSSVEKLVDVNLNSTARLRYLVYVSQVLNLLKSNLERCMGCPVYSSLLEDESLNELLHSINLMVQTTKSTENTKLNSSKAILRKSVDKFTSVEAAGLLKSVEHVVTKLESSLKRVKLSPKPVMCRPSSFSVPSLEDELCKELFQLGSDNSKATVVILFPESELIETEEDFVESEAFTMEELSKLSRCSVHHHHFVGDDVDDCGDEVSVGSEVDDCGDEISSIGDDVDDCGDEISVGSEIDDCGDEISVGSEIDDCGDDVDSVGSDLEDSYTSSAATSVKSINSRFSGVKITRSDLDTENYQF